MVGPINSAVAAALFAQRSAATEPSTGVTADLLTSWMNAKVGVGVDAKSARADPNAPFAPVWEPGISPNAEVYLQRALGGKAFFDTNARLFTDLGATGDYRRLFALFTGLSTLQTLADSAGAEGLSRVDKTQMIAQFERGLEEMQTFFKREQFDDVRLELGDRVDAAQTTLALPQKSEDYTTGLVHRGSLGETLMGLDASAKFDIVATAPGGPERTVSIDLAQMGSLPRSLGNVISFINSALASAGVSTRLEAVDRTPKTSTIVVAGRTITTRYVGSKQYALKVDVRAGESVAFKPIAPTPAFYAVGSVAGGARLIKLSDVDGAAGQPVRLERPGATTDPVGAQVATGWLGPGAPYQAAAAGAYEQRTNVIFSAEQNNFESALRTAGEAVLALQFDDGRTLTVSTAWRADDAEAWRQRVGESDDRALADDLAERLTQLLHEQGVAAGVDVHEDGSDISLSIMTGDLVRATSLKISGRAASLETIDPPNMTGGLREGVYARRFEAASAAAASDLFEGTQTFVLTTSAGAELISIDGGDDGIGAAALMTQLNDELRSRGVAAAASFVVNGGFLDLQINALHSVNAVSATLNGTTHNAALLAPGAWADGGLPVASAGQPLADAIRTYEVTDVPPLLNNAGAVTVEVVVATAAGDKTVSVSVDAGERASDPDPAPGEWSSAFQDRLDAALNAAGLYVDSQGADLMYWSVAEGAGQRLVSVSVNGAALSLSGVDPALGIGGAFSVERSHTSALMATGENDDVADLVADQNVSITFATIWGERTISAALDPGDARTISSAAFRLNEALAEAGYDVGVAAVALSGGGAGLRVVTGASRSIRGASDISLGAQAYAMTLDPIDSASHADDPAATARVSDRAGRGATALATVPAASTLLAPSVNGGGWFPGRAFDVDVGDGARVAAARAVAAGSDGAVYVLADLDGDSATSAIKGARDVALFKYDSAGKLVFSDMLGAAQSASGFAMAISADGKIAIAGAVEGSVSGADAPKGGLDSFVTLLDENGVELWTKRRAATADDEARAIAFAPDGGVIVAGKTGAALGLALALGGSDAYVRGFSASGLELFTRQFGAGGDDAATALLVRDDGGGGAEIFTGGVEGGRGVIRRFTYASAAGLVEGATRDIGYFHTGAINAIAADGASLYVGGEVGADRLGLGATTRAAVAGAEGFVVRLDAGLVSTALDRETYLGSAQSDAVRALAVVGGEVYAAGVAGSVIGGQGAGNTQSAFLARLEATGDVAWTRTFNSAAGALALNALAVDAGGASALDSLGLPRGVVATNDPAKLVSRSALRVGDEFQIGADGRRMTTIRFAAGDTLASLASAISRAIGGAGRAEIVRENGAERIKITPRPGQAVRIGAGGEGRDALPALGLAPGIVALSSYGRGGLKAFGLGLAAADLKLGSASEIARAKAELSAAVSIVRQAYDALLYPNEKAPTAAEKALEERRRNAGPAPSYLAAQLANYQAALARLGGG